MAVAADTVQKLVAAPVAAAAAPPPPPPKSAKKSQQIGGTNWRTNFSAKQVPSALDFSPRPQTHLPFACSVVGFMWNPKYLSIKKKFISRSVQATPQIGEEIPTNQRTNRQTIFRQNRFPVTWISVPVPGPKHAFLLVAQLLESSKILVKLKEHRARAGVGRQKCSS